MNYGYKKDKHWEDFWSTVERSNRSKSNEITPEHFDFSTIVSVVTGDGTEYIRGYWGMNWDGIQTESIYMTPLLDDGPTIEVKISDIVEIKHAHVQKFVSKK
ncbi:hypothetical protein ABGV42_00575 [Paenibacillus pabuli]|uniref:hypothetical protein n=1 Tax=Paenibacillus pabuli TaxID=1472 RepID=UPI0032426FD6